MDSTNIQDSTTVWGIGRIYFHSARKIYETSFYIDNNYIHTTNNPNNQFYFDTRQYADGLHHLKFEFLLSSGTGSLADIIAELGSFDTATTATATKTIATMVSATAPTLPASSGTTSLIKTPA